MDISIILLLKVDNLLYHAPTNRDLLRYDIYMYDYPNYFVMYTKFELFQEYFKYDWPNSNYTNTFNFGILPLHNI